MRLPAESSQKDLWGWIQDNLEPTPQCHKAAKNAIEVLEAIKREFVTFDQDLFGRIYGTFVRYYLEHGLQRWRPRLVKNQAFLEVVQRRATNLGGYSTALKTLVGRSYAVLFSRFERGFHQ
ncbi:hypothetical protein SprV_0200861300 [Sparganum proliferum]